MTPSLRLKGKYSINFSKVFLEENLEEAKMADIDKPLSHKEFMALGKSEAEWDVYAEEQNRLSKERRTVAFVNRFRFPSFHTTTCYTNRSDYCIIMLQCFLYRLWGVNSSGAK